MLGISEIIKHYKTDPKKVKSPRDVNPLRRKFNRLEEVNKIVKENPDLEEQI